MGTHGIRWAKAAVAASVGAAALVLSAPAHADVDSDFANELHSYGIYGQKDYNAWIAKIVCKRMRTGLDADAYEAATFLKTNLHKDSSEQQVYDFLGASIRYYCPDQQVVLDRLAGKPAPPPADLLPAEER
ncbi:DUF732 domain-containing protein [Mycolicibacterium grossiae]|uniref:DUF732 domain-containing protein n=1 Tax=Mycolicibacterium grossiae TaxID=1552759 RepID=A0A1E8Q2P8_9MYCO|nr:DUF732 domain-containing protein [Mycolicibacterium grossiae]OFJ52521.1 hypothetical protein BEL07_16845 [Mycolicibacterium grossiae]QEM47220.1 DUF732 domain-containing protein [Mycolicibacterium grossiae]